MNHLVGFNMEVNSEIKKATDPIYQKVSKAIPEIEWAIYAPYIYKIACD